MSEVFSGFGKRFVQVLTISCCLGTLARAADPTESWKPRYPATAGALAYDDSRHETVQVILGPNGNAETWVWDGSTWTEKFPKNVPNDYLGTMAYDAAHKQVVMFTNGGSTNASETWIWDGNDWTQKFPVNVPPSRVSPAMGYDAEHKKVVLFGGAYYEGSPIYSDTWLWDGTDWTQRFPENSPPPRYNTTLAYDEIRQQTVLFGGYPGLTDTWVWNGLNWTEKSPATNPGPGGQVASAYDATDQGVLVVENNQSWLWNGNDWIEKAATGSPYPINTMVYDSLHQKVVTTVNSSNGVAITWLWSGNGWASKTPGPPARYSHAVATTPSGEVLLFGGYSFPGDVLLSDTWLWIGKDWKQQSPEKSPSARDNFAMVYDEEHRQVVLFGGAGSSGALADTWIWENGDWTKKYPQTNPPARFSYCMAYDSVHQQVVMFGGSGNTAALADTWVWDGRDWEQKSMLHPPAARQGCGMAYDRALQQTIMFGGISGIGAYGDTWTWNGKYWVANNPSTSPAPRFDLAMAYDPARRQVLLFGGGQAPNGFNSYGDTWSWNGSTWSAVNTSPSSDAPSARLLTAMATDPENDQVLLVGGMGSLLPVDQMVFSDTWLWGVAEKNG